MAAFDIIEASGKSYSLVWIENRYLYQLAVVPIVIKFICDIVSSGLGWQDNYFRQAIIMLPSFFAYGWMVAHLVRLILLDQRWPFRPGGNPEEDAQRLRERARGIMAGMLFFVLIEFVTAGLLQFVNVAQGHVMNVPVEQAVPYLFAIFLMLIAFVWGVRLLWLYIPAAVGYPLRQYLHDIRGYSTSFYMIGTGLICTLPVFFLFGFLLSVMLAPYQDSLEQEGLEGLPLLTEFLTKFAIVVRDTIKTLLVTAGMTFGIQEMVALRRQNR